jgi:hypothetical protein
VPETRTADTIASASVEPITPGPRFITVAGRRCLPVMHAHPLKPTLCQAGIRSRQPGRRAHEELYPTRHALITPTRPVALVKRNDWAGCSVRRSAPKNGTG